jgi:hypothetical protein
MRPTGAAAAAVPDEADVHAQGAMNAGARQADVDAIGHGGPGGILRGAVEADLPVERAGVSSSAGICRKISFRQRGLTLFSGLDRSFLNSVSLSSTSAILSDALVGAGRREKVLPTAGRGAVVTSSRGTVGMDDADRWARSGPRVVRARGPGPDRRRGQAGLGQARAGVTARRRGTIDRTLLNWPPGRSQQRRGNPRGNRPS